MSGLQINWEHIGNILAVLFVISIVFETALSPLFNWRIFAQHCEGKGVKTPITIVAAVALLWSYDIDTFKHIIDAFSNGPTQPGAENVAESSSSFLGRIMTGFLVAGGSGAIFNIFTKLGLRDPKQLKQKSKEAREEAEKAKKGVENV